MNEPKTNRNANWPELQVQFALYLKGDARATMVLFTALQKALEGYFFVRMSSKEDANDLSQATLLKIHFYRDRYDSAQSLKTWVFTIASRALIDHWRGSKEEFHAEGDPVEVLDDLQSFELDPLFKTELHHDLNQALKTLKPIERSIVYLYGVEGLSMAEIAQIHSISENAAKIRAHRAYDALKKLLLILAAFSFLLEHYGRT